MGEKIIKDAQRDVRKQKVEVTLADDLFDEIIKSSPIEEWRITRYPDVGEKKQWAVEWVKKGKPVICFGVSLSLHGALQHFIDEVDFRIKLKS